MRWWDTLRTAVTLAQRVEAVEQTVRDLTYEWGDINEKLLAREERLRKRLQRELKANLTEEPEKPAPVATETGQNHQRDVQKQKIIRSWRDLNQQRGA